MLLPLLTITTSLTLSTPQVLARPEDGTIRGTDGQILGDESEPDVALGGALTNPFRQAASIRPSGSRIFEITLRNTGTGWDEPFMIGAPVRPMSGGAPLLVVFHSYGRSGKEITEETRYFQEAIQRGWYVVAPLGAHKYNFGIPYAQDNIQAVLDWATSRLTIDPNRIYGVGFSMGGGGVLSYAARHLDPGHARFAAVFNHTGNPSLRHAYYNSASTTLFENPLLFGGPPDTFPFAYQRSSVIDLDPVDDTIDLDTDVARNLSHVPVHTWSALNDPLQHLVHQSVRLHDQLGVRGAASTLEIGPGFEHAWRTISEREVLDTLEPHTLATPGPDTTVRTIADHDGVWFHFDLTQHSPNRFTPFTWNVQATTNRLFLFQAENLASVRFDPESAGLDPLADLQLVLSNRDGLPLDVELEGYPEPPASVHRNSALSPSWSHDPVTGTLTIHETAAQSFPLWTIEH